MAERRVEHVMGIPVVVVVRDPEVGPGALDRAFTALREADAIFSTYRHGSEISRLNRGDLCVQDAAPAVREVLARCEALRVATHGAFDAHAPRPGCVDPTGLVKGWAVDRAAALLEAAGARAYCVNAGGDIRLRGGPEPGRPWRVGIQHPHRRDRLAAALAATDLAVATSGAYERGAHIVDPRTGRPPAGVLSVTVCGPDLATADAFATAAFAMGEDGPAWRAELAGCEAMTILATGRVLSTPGFPVVHSGSGPSRAPARPERRDSRHIATPTAPCAAAASGLARSRPGLGMREPEPWTPHSAYRGVSGIGRPSLTASTTPSASGRRHSSP